MNKVPFKIKNLDCSETNECYHICYFNGFLKAVNKEMRNKLFVKILRICHELIKNSDELEKHYSLFYKELNDAQAFIFNCHFAKIFEIKSFLDKIKANDWDKYFEFITKTWSLRKYE